MSLSASRTPDWRVEEYINAENEELTDQAVQCKVRDAANKLSDTTKHAADDVFAFLTKVTTLPELLVLTFYSTQLPKRLTRTENTHSPSENLQNRQ